MTALRALVKGGLILTAMLAGGCSTTEGTIGLTAAGVLAAGYVGSQVATHSELSVKVDVYADQGTESSFDEPHKPILARQAMKQLDPVLDPSMSAYEAVNRQLAQSLPGLTQAITRLNRSAENLSAGTDRSNTITQAVDALRDAARATAETIEAAAAFDAEVKSAATRLLESKEDFHPLQQKLEALRAKARAAANFAPKSGFVEALSLELIGAIEQAELPKAQADVTAALKIKDDPQAAMAERLGPYVAKVFHELLPKASADKRATATPSALAVFNNYGLAITQADMVDVINAASDEQAQSKARDVVDRRWLAGTGRLEGISAAKVANRKAYESTFITLTNDISIGTIRAEVLQSLFTAPGVKEITDPKNKHRWQPYSYAKSMGRAGNHDAVIYMENLGTPILKSSAFDPTKFVVANGQAFRKAFAAVVDVFGVPLEDTKPDAKSDATAKATNNLSKVREARKQAVERAATTQKSMIKTLKAVIDAETAVKSLPLTTDAEKKAALDKAAKALNDAAAALDESSKESP